MTDTDQNIGELPPILEQFFTDFKTSTTDGKVKIAGCCKVCKKRIVGDWKPTRVTSNFISHTKLCASLKYAQFESDQRLKRKCPVSPAVNIKKFCRAGGSASVSFDTMDEAISKFVIVDMHPFSTVEHEGFCYMMNRLAPMHKIPTRAKFKNMVLDDCQKVISAVENMTKASKYICAQADIWSSRRMHGYFGASLAFINNHKMETRLVCVKRFVGSHTADNIYVMYKKVMQQFTNNGTVIGIVTDNAANMIKAFLKPTQLDDTEEFVGDESHESVDKQEEERAQPGEDDKGNEVVSNKPKKDDEEVSREPIDWDSVEEEAGTLPVRYPCIAHTLQLVINDGLDEAAPRIKQVLAKSESMVASIHKSQKATEVLENDSASNIPAPNSTRWNSKLSMISAILKLEKNHTGTLQRTCDNLRSKIHLTAIDFAILEELEQLLEPFRLATVRLQSETLVTSSQVLPTLVGLKKKLDKTELRHCTSVKGGLLASLSTRCDALFRQEHFLVASVVDPRFKLR